MINSKQRLCIISGIPPSEGGVGRLMNKISVDAVNKNIDIILRRLHRPLRPMLKKGRVDQIIFELVYRKIYGLYFYLKHSRIRNAKVLFIYPQSCGFGLLLKLLKQNQLVLYVMDNSFFCIRSYNTNPHTHTECLQCIGNPSNADPDCQPFPPSLSRARNIAFLERLAQHSEQITFFAQNNNQAVLLRKHFGDKIDCHTVGMNTGEIAQHAVNHPKKVEFDVVFHGVPLHAKGLDYVIAIASKTPELSFLIPASKQSCERTLGRKIISSNISFRDCNWENGLRQAVESAYVTLNPSQWSAPIEGALLKSIVHARHTATVKTEYAYESEIAEIASITQLPQNLEKAADILREKITIQKNGSGNDPTEFLKIYNESCIDLIDEFESL